MALSLFKSFPGRFVFLAAASIAIKSNNFVRTMVSDSKRTPPPTIGTHSGTFHCDEVLACFMLRQLPEYKNAPIFRSRNIPELHERCEIILDVGGEYDHERKLYDHHQNSFQGTLSSIRPELGNEFNKIRLSSAGLIYAHYGERIIDSILQQHRNVTLSPANLKLSFVQIYRNFIVEIDAIDNGVPMYEGGIEALYKVSTHVSARIGKFNPSWEDDSSNQTVEQRFEQAMTAVGQEFVDTVVQVGASWIKAREYVRQALENAKNVHESGEILLLERFCPWKAHLADLEKEYNVEGVPKLVIFAENEHSWRVAGVPIKPDSFLGRKFLPVPWRGLPEEDLVKVTQIPDIKFVHHTGFIGGAGSKASALAMAIKSVNWQEA